MLLFFMPYRVYSCYGKMLNGLLFFIPLVTSQHWEGNMAYVYKLFIEETV